MNEYDKITNAQLIIKNVNTENILNQMMNSSDDDERENVYSFRFHCLDFA